jgi:polar amino acid transport system permease protein
LLTSIIHTLPGGLLVTLGISLLSAVAGFVIGLLLCWMRCSPLCAAHAIAGVCISALRGIPILVVLLLLFYLPSAAGLEMPSVLAAVLALALNTGAFQAEILRAGFASIPRGQLEAAYALGLQDLRILRRILLPQVLGLTMPQLVNELIILVKNSSLISVIAVTELLRRSEQLVAVTYRPLEVYTATAILYLAANLFIAWSGNKIHQRLIAGRAG